MIEKAKFYVDFCLEAGDAGVCHKYWYEIELSNEEFEELYQVWYDQNELNSWATNWDEHQQLYQKIDEAAVYALNRCLEQEDPAYKNPVDVFWELSKETIDSL